MNQSEFENSRASTKKCPKCEFISGVEFRECPRCGIVVEKFIKAQKFHNKQKEQEHNTGFPQNFLNPDYLKEIFFSIIPDMNPINYGGRILLFLMLVIWGWKLIFSSISSDYAGECFWHLVNLPFHEAGHIIFRPFGRFITSLGGTLGQMLMPFICMMVFLLKNRDTFAASVGLWWFSENFMDIAPYINDARAGVLPLLGGNTGQTSPYGFHDWEFILTESGLINYDHVIAKFSYAGGRILMLISFAWGGYILCKQFKSLKY